LASSVSQPVLLSITRDCPEDVAGRASHSAAGAPGDVPQKRLRECRSLWVSGRPGRCDSTVSVTGGSKSSPGVRSSLTVRDRPHLPWRSPLLAEPRARICAFGWAVGGSRGRPRVAKGWRTGGRLSQKAAAVDTLPIERLTLESPDHPSPAESSRGHRPACFGASSRSDFQVCGASFTIGIGE
jgi:hypothetical protein